MTDSPKDACKVVIGGVNRSGTSLLRALVGSHPLIAVPKTETRMLSMLSTGNCAGEKTEQTLERVLAGAKIRQMGLTFEEVSTHLPLQTDNGPRDIFCAILSAHAKRQGKPWFGEKTTYNEKYFNQLRTWFESHVRFVYVVRHPLNTFASTLMYRGRPSSVDPVGWAHDWQTSVKTAVKLRERYPSNVMVLKYEDCVANAPGTAELLCRFLDIPNAADAMLAMNDFGAFDNSSFKASNGGSNGKRAGGRVADRSSVRRDAIIPDRVRDYLLYKTGGLAEHLGYEIERPTRLAPILALRGVRHIVRMDGVSFGRKAH